MEVEVKVNVSSENRTRVSYTMDGKNMDLNAQENRSNATQIFIAAMPLLNTVYDKKKEGGKQL